MKAYLASALTSLGDVERRRVYKLSDLIGEVCRGNGVELYEPRGATDPVHHPEVPDYEVFEQDRHRIVTSDAVFVIAEYPSTGVGQELLIAQQALVPIVLISSDRTKVSRMVSGMPGVVAQIRFASPSDLARSLEVEIDLLRSHLGSPAGAGSHVFAINLARLRKERHLTADELAIRVHPLGLVKKQDIQLLESLSDSESNPALSLIRALADALRVEPSKLLHAVR